MNSPQETQLGDDLRQLASGQPFTPDLAAIGQRARQRHRRGLALRGGAAAGAVVVAAGGLFIGLHGTATGTAAGTAAGQRGTAGATPRTETVAYVTQQVKTALANVNNYILYSDESQLGDSAENWVDPRTNNDYEILNDGTPDKSVAWLSTYLVNRVLTWKDVEADYSTHTWFTSVIHAAGPIQGSTAGATNSAAVTTPAQIKAWLDSGKLTIVGHRDINGHQTIGLRLSWPGFGYEELWVDSQTFLPVRETRSTTGRAFGEKANVQSVTNDTWLPRTNQLVDMVNHVDIPAGFTQVAPPKLSPGTTRTTGRRRPAAAGRRRCPVTR